MSDEIKSFTGVKDQRVRWGYRYVSTRYPRYRSGELMTYFSGVWYEHSVNGRSETPVDFGPDKPGYTECFRTGIVIGFNSDGKVLVRSDDNDILVLSVRNLQAI